jgi:hypothetical protein
VDDSRQQDLRLSDTERDAAVRALGEHMSAGRLDIDEYGERSAKVTAARTRGELGGLFSDLPEPHPTFGEVAAPTPETAAPEPQQGVDKRPAVPQRAAAALLPIAGILGVVLFFTVGGWWWFLLPALIVWMGGSFSGGGCGGHARRSELDNRLRELHPERRMQRVQRRNRW